MNQTKTIIAGLLGFSLTTIAGFVPWIHWTWQTTSQTWLQSTGVWGPPAYISMLPEATYATVTIETGSQTSLDWMAGLYLFIFLAGTGVWGYIIWRTYATGQPWITVTGGLVSLIIGIGVVLGVGVAGVVAQRAGLYAAIATDQVVSATIERIQFTGPLFLLAGVVFEIIALYGSLTGRP